MQEKYFPEDLYIATDTAFPASPHVRQKLSENELNTLSAEDFERAGMFFFLKFYIGYSTDCNQLRLDGEYIKHCTLL